MLDAMKESSSYEFSVIYRKKLPLLKKDQKHSNQEFSSYLPVEYNYHNASKLINWLLLIINLLSNKHKLYKLINEESPEIIHFNSLVLLPLIKYISTQKEFKDIKIVCHIREPLSNKIHSKYHKVLENIDHFICIDEISKEYLVRSLLNIDMSKITILPNLAEKKIYDTNQPKKQIKTFAFIGRFDADKGPLFVIKAFKKANLSNSKLILFGNGLTLEHLKLKIITWNKEDILIQGFKKNLLKSNLYKSVDVVIRGDSNFVGLGRVGLEAVVNHKILLIPSLKALSLESDKPAKSAIVEYFARDVESLSSQIKKLENSSFQDYNFDISNEQKESLWSDDINIFSNKLSAIYNNL